MQKLSSRREKRSSENGHRVTEKTTGCMSGLFHLLSRHHHSRSRKRLTSAYKKDKSAISPPKPAPSPPNQAPAPKLADHPKRQHAGWDPRQNSCEGPRSPTLPPELRRPASPESPRRPAVARLMGLTDSPPPNSPEPAAEKRRRLLGALEKCDDDLRALKRIIEAAQLPETPVRRDLDGVDSRTVALKLLEFNGEQPSPVSVLEGLNSPGFQRNRLENGKHHKKARDTDWSPLFFHPIISEGLPQMAARKEDEGTKYLGLARKMLVDDDRRKWRARSKRSRAMVESVVEVWRDGEREERLEFGRVGVGLESDILGDLVEELVTEMVTSWYYCNLSFFKLGICKKRLFF